MEFLLTQEVISIQEEANFYPNSSEPEVGLLLNTLIKLVGAKRVLEFGTFKGFATLFMIEAMMSMSNDSKDSVTTVDIRDQRSPILKTAEIESRYTFILDSSLNAVKFLQPPFDLVFIDSVHTLLQCQSEITRIEPLLSSSALIVLHDALSFPAIGQVAHRFSENGYSSLTLPTPIITNRRPFASGVAILKRNV